MGMAVRANFYSSYADGRCDILLVSRGYLHHCAESQWGHDGFWPAGWLFVEAKYSWFSTTRVLLKVVFIPLSSVSFMYNSIAKFDWIVWMSTHTLLFDVISQQIVSFTRRP